MTYNNFIKEVKYTEREVWIPILNQYILKSSFVKDGKYDKELELKFLNAVYEKRKFRKEREETESIVFKGIRGPEGTKK